MTKLTVAICTRNRATYLQSCLSALVEQVSGCGDYEIIVVDNGSTDDTEKVVGNFNVSGLNLKYVVEERLGLSIARNRAISESNGALIAYLDDDAIPYPDWIEKLIKSWEIHRADCFGGKVIPIWEAEKPSWLSNRLESNYSLLNYSNYRVEMTYPDHPWGVNIVFDRKMLLEIGGFPEELGRVGNTLLSGEESWVCKKIHEKKGSIWYDPEIVVQHCIPRERLKIGWLRRRIFWSGVSDSVYILKSSGDRKACTEKAFKKLRKLLLRPDQIGWLILSFVAHKHIEKAGNCVYKIGYLCGAMKYRDR